MSTSPEIAPPQMILDYWFAAPKSEWDRDSGPPEHIEEINLALWWGREPCGVREIDPQTRVRIDEEMATLFQGTIMAAEKGTLLEGVSEWTSDELKESVGGLALLILNGFIHPSIHRNDQRKVLANERVSETLAKMMIDLNADTSEEFGLYERLFIYRTLLKSGFREKKDLGQDKVKQLLSETQVNVVTAPALACLQQYATDLEEAWSIFDLNPYRRKVMGNNSTEEELEFMEAKPWGHV
uniref:Uncharacterized protein n=1 Tax=Lotharella globosa TaxID=91324 RepID=A0A7S3ZCB4_9EUKA